MRPTSREYAALYEQAWNTPGVAAGAGPPASFMIFDDHEVTDDWNADPGWLKMVHSEGIRSDAGRHHHRCALRLLDVSGLGNLSPDTWAGDPRVQILDDAASRERCAARFAPPAAARFDARRREDREPKTRPDGKLDWHFELPTGDSRSWRSTFGPTGIVNRTGGMSTRPAGLARGALAAPRVRVAIVVLPVPFLMPDPMLFVFRHPGFAARLAGERSTAGLQARRPTSNIRPATRSGNRSRA